MNKLSALFFVLLVNYSLISCVRQSFFETSKLASKSIRGQLTQIMVEVKTTDNVNTIRQFLGVIVKMCKKLQAAQAKHAKVSKKMMKQCKDEDKFRKTEVAAAKDSLSRAGQAIEKCNNSLQASLKNLPELEHTLTAYRNELKRATEQREREHKEYLIKKADYTEAVHFLGGFIEYVEKKFKGNFKAFSFVEYSEQVLKHASKLGRLAESVPVLVELAQNMPKHNTYVYTPAEKVAGKLKDALHNLLETLKTDLKDIEDREAKAQAAFEKYKAKLMGLIASLEASIKKTKQQIVAMRKCIKEEKVIAAKAGAKLARNAKLKAAARKMCKNFAREFVRATKNRLAEIQAIHEILVICKKRFGQLPKHLVSYLESVRDGWIKYVNSTEFHKFVAYKQKHIKDNAHGRSLTQKKNRLKKI